MSLSLCWQVFRHESKKKFVHFNTNLKYQEKSRGLINCCNLYPIVDPTKHCQRATRRGRKVLKVWVLQSLLKKYSCVLLAWFPCSSSKRPALLSPISFFVTVYSDKLHALPPLTGSRLFTDMSCSPPLPLPPPLPPPSFSAPPVFRCRASV